MTPLKAPRMTVPLLENAGARAPAVVRVDNSARRMPSTSWVELTRALQQKVPHVAHMRRRRAQVADRHANRQSTALPRVRDEDVARFIDEIDQPLVCRVELGLREWNAAGIPAETDDTQRNRREPLEIGMRVDPRRELGGEADVFRQPLA